jgi:hypothetical protein
MVGVLDYMAKTGQVMDQSASSGQKENCEAWRDGVPAAERMECFGYDKIFFI